jgi:hypothetical protein
MNVGVGQTGGTCWFNASLNMFLTSDDGLKIFWKKLQGVYRYFSKQDKEFFMSDIDVPCPYKGGVRKTRAVYFWKFLNNYICAVGGPGQLLPKSELNAFLTKNVKWRSPGLREAKGARGAFPAKELPALLTHLGFREGPDFRMLDFDRWHYQFKKPEWNTPILMYRKLEANSEWKLRIPLTDLLTVKKGYDLTGAIVYIAPARDSTGSPHVWSCSVRNGKGYIIDSNYPHTPHECMWWKMDNLKRFLGTVHQDYRPGKALIIGFEVIMYTRQEFTSKINPSCQLPKSYRPLKVANKMALREFDKWGPNAVKYVATGQLGEARKQFAPRVLAEAIRVNAKRPLATAALYNDLFRSARNFQEGINMPRKYLKNYKVNKEGQNYKNFQKKLLTKFGRPVPKDMLEYFWKTRSSNANFVKKITSWAPKAGYIANTKQLNAIVARRAATRAGVKRAAERVYLVNGVQWRNSNGDNVTSRINSTNWVKTKNNSIAPLIASYTNAAKIETFRRKP